MSPLPPTFRVLDMACGSGSFLLGAYQYLLDYYLRWYTGHEPEKWSQAVYLPSPGGRGAGGEGWRLTTAERKRILLNHIYGVDIDRQAVEVAKLSLLLKVLEGESDETLGKQLSLFQERALPNLDKNIKCGNSLIGPDYFTGQLLPDADELRSVNPFDWESEFTEVFNRKDAKDTKGKGGFDCIIGNPPYVLLQSLGLPQVEEYLRKNFSSARYKIDTYQIFLEKACRLTKLQGLVGLITPNTFLRNKFSVALRAFLLQHTEVEHIRLFDYGVFTGVSVDTVVSILRRVEEPNPSHRVTVDRAVSISDVKSVGEISQSNWATRADLNFDLPGGQIDQQLTERIEAGSIPLGDFATAYFGIQTHGRTEYVSKRASGRKWKPALDGGNINRYHLAPPQEFVCIEPHAIKSGGNSAVYEQDRIGVRQIGRRPVATLLPGGWYSLNTIYNIFFTRNVEYSLKYILGLMLSALLGWYWEQRYFDQKQTFPKIKKAPLLALPIRRINFSDPADKARHDRMVTLVEQMLDQHKRLAAAHDAGEQGRLQRLIDSTDRQIDLLVYELYGLTAEEIAIVEGGQEKHGLAE